MSEIIFYKSNDNTEQQYQQICEILSNSYNNNRFVYVLCPNAEYCYNLDEYIINYISESKPNPNITKNNNFFTYQLFQANNNQNTNNYLYNSTNVTLSYISHISHIDNNIEIRPNIKYDILLNLSKNIPSDFIKYKTIIEFLNNIDINISRDHYRHYAKYSTKYNFDIKIKEHVQ